MILPFPTACPTMYLRLHLCRAASSWQKSVRDGAVRCVGGKGGVSWRQGGGRAPRQRGYVARQGTASGVGSAPPRSSISNGATERLPGNRLRSRSAAQPRRCRSRASRASDRPWRRRVLICADAMTEDAYLMVLAASLGTSYEPLERISRADCPLDDDQLVQAASAGLWRACSPPLTRPVRCFPARPGGAAPAVSAWRLVEPFSYGRVVPSRRLGPL